MQLDLAPLVNTVIIPLLAPTLMACAAWAAAKLASYAHVQLQDSQRALLNAAITNALNYAEHQLAGHETVTVSEKVATAVAYLQPKIPGALKSLGVTPDHLADLVIARLPAA